MLPVDIVDLHARILRLRQKRAAANHIAQTLDRQAMDADSQAELLTAQAEELRRMRDRTNARLWRVMTIKQRTEAELLESLERLYLFEQQKKAS